MGALRRGVASRRGCPDRARRSGATSAGSCFYCKCCARERRTRDRIDVARRYAASVTSGLSWDACSSRLCNDVLARDVVCGKRRRAVRSRSSDRLRRLRFAFRSHGDAPAEPTSSMHASLRWGSPIRSSRISTPCCARCAADTSSSTSPALTPHAQRLLRRIVDSDYLIELSASDARNLACNAVEVGDALIMHDASRALREQLVDAGYRVFSTDLLGFVRNGAGAKRLTLRLDDGPASAGAAA